MNIISTSAAHHEMRVDFPWSTIGGSIFSDFPPLFPAPIYPRVPRMIVTASHILYLYLDID